jgi:hypothetical protein
MTAQPGKTPLVEVRGLTVAFDGVTALDGIDITLWPDQVLGIVGGNRGGQIRSGAGADKAPAVECRDRRRRHQGGGPVDHRYVHGRPPSSSRRRGGPDRHGRQDASRSRPSRRRAGRRRASGASEDRPQGGDGGGHRSFHQGRDRRSRPAGQCLSAPAFRRHGAAYRHRHGADRRAEGHPGRRCHARARRDDPGPGSRPARGALPRTGHGRTDHHARPRHRRPLLRPRRDHAQRQDRGGNDDGSVSRQAFDRLWRSASGSGKGAAGAHGQGRTGRGDLQRAGCAPDDRGHQPAQAFQHAIWPCRSRRR